MKKGKIAFFVTGNVHKFHEARSVLREFGVSTALLNLDTTEIQADDLGVIAEASALEAARKTGMPVFVEDAGLFISALNGFPGAYSSYVYRTLGTRGVLKLMKNIRMRDACFCSVVAFCEAGNTDFVKCFRGKVDGKITFNECGKHGFGFDPIFVPLAEPSRTFAEMAQHEKNQWSHRAEALRKFGEWHVRHHAQLRI